MQLIFHAMPLQTSSVVFTLCLLICVSTETYAHQSIAFPVPITRELACRKSATENCPGPCPTRLKRFDQVPQNPSATVRRGRVLTVHTLRNNHEGGFSRWSLVNAEDKHSKAAHRRNAFFYSCADVRVSKCTDVNKWRDCPFDLQNEYYKHHVKIPTTARDGVYVLGWVWFVFVMFIISLLSNVLFYRLYPIQD